MKKVFWTYTSNSSTYDGENPQALSLLEEGEDGVVRFLGSVLLEPVDGKYQFCAFNKDRVLCTVQEREYPDTLEEARRAVEEFVNCYLSDVQYRIDEPPTERAR